MQANLETIAITADFSLQIEDIVRAKGIPYMEAIEVWCNDNGKDITVGADHVKKSSIIKEKIRVEAEDLNLLPRTAKLPI